MRPSSSLLLVLWLLWAGATESIRPLQRTSNWDTQIWTAECCRDELAILKKLILHLESQAPSRTISNIGGWQSGPELFEANLTAKIPALATLRSEAVFV